MSRRKPRTMTDALKRAIAESGATFLELERATGVKRQSIMRFMRDEQTLRLDIADKLAVYFAIRVVSESKR